MKAIIIAAGSGTRLGKLTKELPKGMLEINGKTILQRQVSLFLGNGIDDIIIIIGPNKEKIDLENVSYIHDFYYCDHDVLGSLMAASYVMDGELLTSYSDILYDESILKTVLKSKADIGIAVDLNWEKAYVDRTLHPRTESDNVLIRNGKVLQIKKNITKCEKNDLIGEFLGLMKLSAKGTNIFVNKYKQLENSHHGIFHEALSLKKAYLTDMLQELIDFNVDIFPILIDGKWCEIDTLQDLEKAKKMFV